jgi:aspartyl-tRNA(Asn)/glutamyl-tRNA(Gln) amidotransferase subunit C
VKILVKPPFCRKIPQAAECIRKNVSKAPCEIAILKIRREFLAVCRFYPEKDMKVTEKEVAYVAELANLELTSDERTRLLRDLNSILEYVDRLNELDTSQVRPMAQVSATGESSRDDILEGLRKSLPHEVALANAPDTDGTFFRVPKVIER